MDTVSSAIATLDSSAKVTANTLSRKLLPSLNQKLSSESRVDAIDILNNFTTSGRQLDALWHSIQPQFCWTIVVPKNVAPQHPGLSKLYSVHIHVYIVS